MTEDKDDLLVWVDIETTGLNGPEREKLLEVALLVTNKWGDEIDSHSIITATKAQGRLEAWEMGDYVLDMHTKSGLMEEYNHRLLQESVKNCTMETYAGELVEFLNGYISKGEIISKPPMAGSNVANFDRPFIKHVMPELEGVFHYRNIDVSTIRELCRRLAPSIYERAPKKRNEHRGAADLEDSIAEYRFYVDNFLYAED